MKYMILYMNFGKDFYLEFLRIILYNYNIIIIVEGIQYMNDLYLLRTIEESTGIQFKQMKEIDYRDDQAQYTYDQQNNIITGIKLARRATKVPIAIFNLKNIEVLDLSLAKISEVPTQVTELSRLKKLNLYHTLVESLPVGISKLKNLENIHLGETPISHLPDELCQLPNLKKLTLWGTKIRELPSEIGNLKNLLRLDLSSCRLRAFPESIVDLQIDFTTDDQTYDGAIRIVGTDVDDKKMLEYAKRGKHALASYFSSDEFKYPRYDYESKLILLGNGAVGKTCIVQSLLNNFFDMSQRKTEGIEISNLSLNIDEKKACVHLWDFGGQNIYHPLYTLFMSDPAIYMVVLNGRSDDKPDEWLQFIHTFAPNSPVIIVINRIDENPRADINREYYLRKFKNIKRIIRCSCKNSDTAEGRIDDLRQAIIDIVKGDERYKMNWKDSWLSAKRELEEIGEESISYSQYSNICISYGVSDRKEKQELFDKLIQVGCILSFQQKTYNVLNPNWLSRSFSCLYSLAEKAPLDISIKKGYLFDALYKLNNSYEIDKCEYIVQILANFHLCYPYGDNIFMPGVLKICLDEVIGFDYSSWYKAVWRYTTSPTLVMQRVLTKQFNSIYNNSVWRNGVLLTLWDTKVLLIQSEFEITAYIQDENLRLRRDCLNYIRTCIYSIHTELNMSASDVTELIVLRKGDKEILYPLENLKILYDMKIDKFAVPELQTFFDTSFLLGENPVSITDNTSSRRIEDSYQSILDRLDSMKVCITENKDAIEALIDTIRKMYDNPSETNKRKVLNALKVCGNIVLTILGGSADALALFEAFGIPFPGL